MEKFCGEKGKKLWGELLIREERLLLPAADSDYFHLVPLDETIKENYFSLSYDREKTLVCR